MGRLKRVGLVGLALGVVIAVGVAGWTLLSSPFSTPNPPSAKTEARTDDAISSSAPNPASQPSPADAGSTASDSAPTDAEASTASLDGSVPGEPPDSPTEQTAADEPPTASVAPASERRASSSGPSTSTETSREATPRTGIVEQGRLALEIDGRPFSTETYELTRRADGSHLLTSEGTFSVPVMVADVSFDYAQTIRLASQWQPRAYTFDLKGPLGFGNRHIDAQFEDDSARVTRGGSEEPRRFHLARERYAVVGMLASYTLIPKLLADDDSAQLSAMVVSFRGEDGPGDGDLSTVPLRIERAGTARIRAADGGQPLDVTHLTLAFTAASADEASAPLDLYVQGDRFLALRGRFSAESSSFRIYDLERFPTGFEAVANGAVAP